MKLDLVYFAWVREKIGKSGETIDVPSTVTSVGELLNHLKGLGEEYQEALQHDRVIRVAIDQEHAEYDEKIAGARGIGIFPPMTGG